MRALLRGGTGTLAACAIAAAFVASAASAEMHEDVYTAVSPTAVQAIFELNSLPLALDELGGDTTLRGAHGELPFEILFYECDGRGFSDPATPESACLSYEYRAYAPFEVEGEDAEIANRWNEIYHFGKAWRDELGGVAVQMNVVIDGGVTSANLMATYDRWRRTLNAFVRYLEEYRR